MELGLEWRIHKLTGLCSRYNTTLNIDANIYTIKSRVVYTLDKINYSFYTAKDDVVLTPWQMSSSMWGFSEGERRILACPASG